MAHSRPIVGIGLALCLVPAQFTFQRGFPAGADEILRSVAEYRTSHAADILQQYRQFLSLPNVSADRDAIRRNAEYLLDQFRRRGAVMQLLEVPGANPVVYGELNCDNASRTIALYAHFDGQPVNPGRWTTTEPFLPRLYSRAVTDGGRPLPWPEPGQAVHDDWRIYGRSTSDDKAALAAILVALDALAAQEAQLRTRFKFFFDGEEETGSPNMGRVLAQHRDKFEDIDLWVFCDGPLHQSRQPSVYYGVRGVTGMEITVFGANRNLHSGHYGNWAPNPALQLAQLLASMKDGDGNVLIPGFYDGIAPLTSKELRAMDQVPAIDDQMRDELGLVETENAGQSYIERMQLPSLNIRGLSSATVGSSARNIVPNEATASLDIRLVKGNDPAKMLKLVEDHIQAQGYTIVRQDPDMGTRRAHPKIARVTHRSGYPAARTAMDDPQAMSVAKRLEVVAGRGQLLHIPSLGGSLPLYLVTDDLRQPLIILPIANHDNNQHAPDENIRLGNLFYGIDAMAALLTIQ